MGAELLREVAEIGRVQIDAEWPALADPAARPGSDRLHQFLLAVAEHGVRNGGQAGLELGGHRGLLGGGLLPEHFSGETPRQKSREIAIRKGRRTPSRARGGRNVVNNAITAAPPKSPIHKIRPIAQTAAQAACDRLPAYRGGAG